MTDRSIMGTQLDLVSWWGQKWTWFEMKKIFEILKIASRIAGPEIHKFRNKFLLQLKQHFRFSQSLLTLDSISFPNQKHEPYQTLAQTLTQTPELPWMTQNFQRPISNLHFDSRFLQRRISCSFVSIITPTWSCFVLHVFSNKIRKLFTKLIKQIYGFYKIMQKVDKVTSCHHENAVCPRKVIFWKD